MLLFGKESGMLDARSEKKLKGILNPMMEDSINIEEVKSLPKDKDEKCSAVLVTNHSNILNYLEYLLKSGTQKF